MLKVGGSMESQYYTLYDVVIVLPILKAKRNSQEEIAEQQQASVYPIAFILLYFFLSLPYLPLLHIQGKSILCIRFSFSVPSRFQRIFLYIVTVNWYT